MRSQRGQSSILMLGVVAVVLAGALILGALGQAYGARGHAQRVADLAAIAAAQSMRENYPRLFELSSSPRHLTRAEYLALAREAAVRGATRNGGSIAAGDVAFPDASSFAPTRVRVRVRDHARLRIARGGRGANRRVPVKAEATAGASAGPGAPGGPASGGGHTGRPACPQGGPV